MNQGRAAKASIRTMLEICGIQHSFQGLEVIARMDLEAGRGDFTVLIGPSGCGKTTLFNILTGVVARQRGQIRWQGSQVEHLEQTAAYMQQKDLLLPWCNLLDNALLPARMDGRHMPEARRQAIRLFARLGLEGFESYLPAAVSGGMRQRCALVRTLMFARPLVLLDEPLSALDAITRRSLQSLLLLLQQDFAKTIVMITHDVEEALLLADRLVIVSRRPMQVLEVMDLDSPKPRQAADPGLLRLKERILNVLQQELVA